MESPILVWELRRAVGSTWIRRLRYFYGCVVVCLFCWHALEAAWVRESLRHSELVRAPRIHAEQMWYIAMAVHLGAVAVLTPLLSVGGLLREKRQRTLELLLTTALRPIDLVAAHLLAAWLKVLLLTLPILPLLFWLQGYFNQSASTLLLWIMAAWIAAIPAGAVSIACVVFMRKPLLTIAVAYAGSIILHSYLAGFLSLIHSGTSFEIVWTEKFWLALSLWAMLVTIAFCQLAAIGLGKLLEMSAAPAFALSTPLREPMTDSPVHWRHLHHFAFGAGPLPRPSFAVVHRPILSLIFAAFCWAVGQSPLAFALICVGAFLLPLATLFRSASAVTSEKEAQTWDLLRMTPMTASEFVIQSVDGIANRFHRIWWILFPGVVILMDRWSYQGMLAVAAWGLAKYLIYHCAIAGLHSSVHRRSTLASIVSATGFFLAKLLVVLPLSWLLAVGCSFSGVNQTVGFRPAMSVDLCAVLSSACFFLILFGLFLTLFWSYSVRYHVQTVETLVKQEGFERAGRDTTSYNDRT